jgi:hypothetical protein
MLVDHQPFPRGGIADENDCDLMAVTLAGCVTDQPVTPADAAPPLPPAPPTPKMTWVKPGSTHDEFIRTRGGCELRSMNGFSMVIKNIFDACMNANGWELVPEETKQ